MLDPIVAIRCSLALDPEQSATIDIVTGVGETRDICREPGREIPGPAPRGPRLRSGLDAQPGGAAAAQRHRGRRAALCAPRRAPSSTPTPPCAPTPAVLIKNRRGQSGLWGYAISGDLPIVLLQIGDPANIELVRQLVQAHAYWRLKGLAVDLVIWNEDHAGYRQLLQEQIMGLIAAGIEASVIDRPGGIFVRPADQISGRGPHPAPGGRARHHHRQPAGRWPNSSTVVRPLEPRAPRFTPSRTHRPERHRRRRAAAPGPDPLQRARAASPPTAASTSSRPRPGR